MENPIGNSIIRRSSAINALFWGLLIIFINIKIMKFDIFNDIIGLLIVIYGLYQLRTLLKMFLYGLYFALFSLSFQIFNTVLNYSLYAAQQSFYIPMFLIGLTATAFVSYFTLNGLAQLAKDQNLNKLSTRLKFGLAAYLLTMILSVISIFYLPVAFIFIVLCCIIYIYILKQIRSAYNHISGEGFEYSHQSNIRGSIKIVSVVALCFVLPFLLGIGMIVIPEVGNVKTSLFIQNDLSEDTNEITDIRTEMVALGFQPDVVQSLPDSEIVHYRHITDVQKGESQEFSCDGGVLEIKQYVSNFDSEEYRFMVYYQWLKKPKLAYAESVGIVFLNEEVESLEQSKISSFNLYDMRDGKTYFSEDIRIKDKITNFAKKFKLIHRKDADNYRGFLSFNAKFSKQTWISQNTFYYIHQSTPFNNRGTDIIDFNNDRRSFTIMEETRLFKTYNIIATLETNAKKLASSVSSES